MTTSEVYTKLRVLKSSYNFVSTDTYEQALTALYNAGTFDTDHEYLLVMRSNTYGITTYHMRNFDSTHLSFFDVSNVADRASLFSFTIDSSHAACIRNNITTDGFASVVISNNALGFDGSFEIYELTTI